MTDAMESMSLDRIIELCKQIEQGYQSGKSGLDTGMVDQVLQLSDNAAALASALRELDEARGLLGDLCGENQFDFTHSEVESYYALKVRCRGYVRKHLPQHGRGLGDG